MKNMQESADEKFLNKIIEKYPNLKRYPYTTIYNIHKQFIELSSNNSRDDTKKGISLEQFIELMFQHLPHIKTLSDGKSGVVILFFRNEHTDDFLCEVSFMKLLSIIAKGSLSEQFELCCQKICTNPDNVVKADFRGVLDVLYRIAYTGTASYDACAKRLDTFSEIVYEKLRGHQDSLSTEKLKELILDTRLLDNLWAQLFINNK